VAGGIVPEAHQALKNIQATLKELNLSLDHVFKCLVMIDDIDKWGQFNSVYIQYFKKPYPARSAFGADGLAVNASFEMECIAKIPTNH
jgi:enamine deaminase RidA (YjgF/YER057c/UK114 family)